MPKSSYLNWKVHHGEDEDQNLKTRIKDIFEYHKTRYGYRRITAVLHQEGLIVNHKKVKRLMKEMGLYPAAYKRSRYSSYKGEVGKTVPNILKRAFSVKKPDKVWATDVTEFRIPETGKKLYLSAILDLYDRYPVAFVISGRNDNQLVFKTFDKARFSIRDT